MSQFSLFTFDSEKDDLLHALQKFAYVHFTNLKEDAALMEEGLQAMETPWELEHTEEELQKTQYALNLLKRHDDRETGLKGMMKGKDRLTFAQLEARVDGFDHEAVLKEMKTLSGDMDALHQEELKLKALLEELHPWRNLLVPVKRLRGFDFSSIFVGSVPKKLLERLLQDVAGYTTAHVEVVSEDKNDAYLVALASRSEAEALQETLRESGFVSVRIPGEEEPKAEMESIGRKLTALAAQKKEKQEAIKGLAPHLGDFEVRHEYLLNKKVRYGAETNFLRTDNVKVIKGYVPTEKEDDFRKAVEVTQHSAYFLEFTPAEEGSRSVPVLLKNGRFSEAFESLTTMYSLPKYGDIDPTPYFAPFYFVFFGMMIADLGYGFILLLLTLFALKKMNLSKGAELFIRFLHYLSYSVMAWGVVYGSAFGDLLPLPRLLNPEVDYQSILILSVIFGGIHLFYALAIKAMGYIRNGKTLDVLYDVIFWYMALMGAIVLLLTMFMDWAPLVTTLSAAVMAIGMGGIVLTGGRENESVFGKLAGGLYSLYGITGYIGDFVSYSRLMALGLAGGFIAVAINMMMGMLLDMGIIGILPAVVVFIVGQLFNLFLSALSAYVHSSRLIYVEFFGKFYEGGGKAFKLFRNKSKYINMEN